MKFLLFIILSFLTGNFFFALIIVLVLVYLLDRKFVGVLPSISKPFRRARNIRQLRQQLVANSFDLPAKRELARLLLEQKKYREAEQILLDIQSASESSPEFWSDLGEARLGLGKLELGESHMLQALSLNERVRYGQPYLSLAIAFREQAPDKAITYAKAFKDNYSSSCEAFYLLGSVYRSLGLKEEAHEAFKESVVIYRSLPKYKKRIERRWAFKSYISKIITS